MRTQDNFHDQKDRKKQKRERQDTGHINMNFDKTQMGFGKKKDEKGIARKL